MMNSDNEFFNIRNNFREFYENNLKTRYAQLEPKRKQYLISFYIRAAVLVPLYSLLFWSIISALDNGLGQDIIYAVGLVVYYVCSRPFVHYKKDTKSLVMNKILSFWGNFKYFNDDGRDVSEEIINKSQLFGTFNERKCDDTFQGTYNGSKVTVSEQKLTRVQGSGRERYEVLVFKGVLIFFDLAKNFQGKTIVHKKHNFINSFLTRIFHSSGIGRSLIGCWLEFLVMMILTIYSVVMFYLYLMTGKILNSVIIFLVVGFLWFYLLKKDKKGDDEATLQQVNLEDVVFDKKWKVLASDQVEARFVLTPALMERMLLIKKRFYGTEIEFSFFDNKVLIAVHTDKDMFETTSLFTPALSYKHVHEVIEQFYAVFSCWKILNGEKISQ